MSQLDIILVDSVLCPAPHYYGIQKDIGQNSQLKTISVYIEEVDSQGKVTLNLTVDKIKAAYEEAIEQVSKLTLAIIIILNYCKHDIKSNIAIQFY